MKLSEELRECHLSGDFGQGLEGLAEKAECLEDKIPCAAFDDVEVPLYSNTRYDRLTTGIRRKSLSYLDEFGVGFPEGWREFTDLDWLKLARDLIDKEIERNGNKEAL